jgi:ATP-binding cassette subfamily B protein
MKLPIIELFSGFTSNVKTNLLKSILASVCMNLLSILILYQFKSLIDNFSVQGNLLLVRNLSFVIVILIVLSAFSEYLYITYSNKTAVESQYTIRNTLFDHILKIKYRFFSKKYFSRLNTNIIQDVRDLCDNLFKQLSGSFSEGIYFLVSFIILLLVNYKMTILLFAFIGLFTIYVLFLKEKMEKFTRRYAESRTVLNTIIDDYLEKIKSIQLYGIKDSYLDRIDAANKALNTNWFKLNIFGPLIQSSIEFAILGSYLLVFFLAMSFIGNGELTPGGLFLFLTYLPQLWDKYSAVVNIYSGIVQSQVYADRIFGMLKTETYEDEQQGSIKQIDGEPSAALDDISFSYEEGQALIKNKSFSFSEPGIYRIAGPSGSGKSTLFDLLLKLYPVSHGQILINNLPIDKMDNKIIREYLGIIHQDPYFISGTIIENIQFGCPDINEKDIRNFLNSFGFSHYEYLSLDASFSGETKVLTYGMKRIISIARVILRNPRILLFDEITANLDSHTERMVLDFIKKISNEKICLFISHKQGEGIIAKETMEIG